MSQQPFGLPPTWALVRLDQLVGNPGSDIVDGPFGSNLKASEYIESGVPIIRLQNVSPGEFVEKNTQFVSVEKAESLRRHSYIPGDLVITKLGSPLGEACVVPAHFPAGIIVADIVRVRPHSLIDKYALMYALNSPKTQQQFKELTKGTTRPRVNLHHVRAIKVPLLPSGEQSLIVLEIEKQFTRLDAATVALKRVQANLKRYRASVLKSACEGRLVPTEAELARKEGRDYEPADKLLQRILRERRARWETDTFAKMRSSGKPPKDDHWKQKYKEPSTPDLSNLPSLPEGWCWAGLEQIAIFQNGRPFPSAQYKPDGFKLIRPGNLHVSGRVVWDEKNTRCLPIAFANENPDLIVKGNELIMNLTAQSLKDEFLGRICVTDTDDVSLLNQRLARITPVLVPPIFLLWVLKSWRFRRFVDQLNTGSLIQHMFTSQLAEFAIALPPLAEQQWISEAVDKQLSTLNVHEELLDRTHSRSSGLRQAVLVSAFTGQLVPQDPTDQPASVLLERIRAERIASGSQKPARRSRMESWNA